MYPDTPSREIDPAHLTDMNGWFCKLKIDGWRCIVHVVDGGFKYLSKTLAPLKVPDDIRLPFERYVRERHRSDIILDCELTGNRRKGDAASIVILDAINDMPALGRYYFLQRTFPDYLVPACEQGFATFFEQHKTNPLAEGVVLFKSDGMYIGHRRQCALHPGIIKCKWRAGMSGTVIKDVIK